MCKKSNRLLLIFLFIGSLMNAQSFAPKDTLVDLGDLKLNFTIVKGRGTPILFESGAGSDGSAWNPILRDLFEITGSTLITYDREGFGKSIPDTSNMKTKNHNVLAGVKSLEKGLKMLGYDENIMLVSHSFGSFYNYLFAARNPQKVKAMIAIDVVHRFHEDGYAESLFEKYSYKLEEWRKTRIGMYFLFTTLVESKDIIAKTEVPQHIPVVDILAGKDYSADEKETKRWIDCHQQFIDSHPLATGITAHNAGHTVWLYNPGLVINTIVQSYVTHTSPVNAEQIYQRVLAYSIKASNDLLAGVYSEDAINNLGYDYYYKKQFSKAIAIFEMNVELYPNSFNTYDSLADALEQSGEKERALKMYKKSVELNPDNQNGVERIKALSNG